MRLKMVAFLSVGLFCAVAARAGFLQPTEFPKVVDDLSFVDRMMLKSADYDTLESVYDANGNCVSGCAYVMPKWEDQLAATERWNRMVHQELIDEHGYTENDDGSLTPPPAEDYEYYTDEQPKVDFPSTVSDTSYVVENSNCATRNSSFAAVDIPRGNPLGYIACITSPYGPRSLFGRNFHHGMDFNARRGTPVYAPANGVVEWVCHGSKSCGNGIQIKHANGYSTRYCHFDYVAVKQGDTVSAGCLIGKSGNTGQSTGPHLHYAVLKNGAAVNPIDYIETGHKSCYAKN